MVARLPERLYIWPFLTGMCARPPSRDRAAVATDDGIVAQMLAQFPARQPEASLACPSRVARVSITCHQSFIPDCAISRKPRSSFFLSNGSRFSSTVRLSPTSPTSTGKRKPIRIGSMSICTPLAWSGLGRIRCTGMTCRPLIACRISPSRLAMARCRAVRCASGVRTVIGNDRFAQQWFDDRRGQQLRDLFKLLVRQPNAPRPARIATFFPEFRMSAAC